MSNHKTNLSFREKQKEENTQLRLVQKPSQDLNASQVNAQQILSKQSNQYGDQLIQTRKKPQFDSFILQPETKQNKLRKDSPKFQSEEWPRIKSDEVYQQVLKQQLKILPHLPEWPENLMKKEKSDIEMGSEIGQIWEEVEDDEEEAVLKQQRHNIHERIEDKDYLEARSRRNLLLIEPPTTGKNQKGGFSFYPRNSQVERWKQIFGRFNQNKKKNRKNRKDNESSPRQKTRQSFLKFGERTKENKYYVGLAKDVYRFKKLVKRDQTRNRLSIIIQSENEQSTQIAQKSEQRVKIIDKTKKIKKDREQK